MRRRSVEPAQGDTARITGVQCFSPRPSAGELVLITCKSDRTGDTYWVWRLYSPRSHKVNKQLKMEGGGTRE